jgi:hypothetical protein
VGRENRPGHTESAESWLLFLQRIFWAGGVQGLATLRGSRYISPVSNWLLPGGCCWLMALRQCIGLLEIGVLDMLAVIIESVVHAGLNGFWLYISSGENLFLVILVDWNQDLTLARQVPLEQSQHLFVIFEIGYCFTHCLTWTLILLHASYVAVWQVWTVVLSHSLRWSFEKFLLRDGLKLQSSWFLLPK